VLQARRLQHISDLSLNVVESAVASAARTETLGWLKATVCMTSPVLLLVLGSKQICTLDLTAPLFAVSAISLVTAPWTDDLA